MAGGELREVATLVAKLTGERDELKLALTEANIALVNMKAERDAARELIREVAACGVSYSSAEHRETQIPWTLWYELRKARGGE